MLQKDMLYYLSPDMTDKVACKTMAYYVGDPKLYQAIQTLTPKQRDILTHRYVRGLQNKENSQFIRGFAAEYI